jgi:Apea-like HEPN
MKQDDFIGIAYHRYETALTEGLPEGSIALAINCLEALYLDGEEGELAHRLSQRTAALLRQKLGDSGIDIYKKIKDAYTIRSKFVHGAVESKSASKRNTKRRAAHDLNAPILNYARVSLLIFLQLRKVKGKTDFLKLIDSSLLDETAHKEFVDLVKPIIVA